MPISSDQNSETSLRRLAAQRYVYSKAKGVVSIRKNVSLVLAIVGVLAAILLPFLKPWSAIVGVVWAILLAVILKQRESALKKRAATIQEEFDCVLYDLKWNDNLVGARVTPELVSEFARKFK